MSEFHTVFGSLDSFEKGRIEVINDDPKNYAFSNVFEVASKSPPYQKVGVGKNPARTRSVLMKPTLRLKVVVNGAPA